VFVGGQEVARLGDAGFETDTMKVTISDDGHATVRRHDHTDEMVYSGLTGRDSCIAALLFYMTPVPRAG
jgi:hypothetical protein